VCLEQRFPIARFSAPQRIRVVLASGALVSYVSVWRATARGLVELGAPAFFIAGASWAALGPAAPWFVLTAVALGAAMRAADVEARALFVPGGLYGSVRETLGGVAAKVAAAALLVERLLLGPLAALVAGHYVAAIAGAVAGRQLSGAGVSSATLANGVAVALLGAVWWLQRQGRVVPDRAVSRAIGLVVCFLALVVLWGGATAATGRWLPESLPLPSGATPLLTVVLLAAAAGHALSALGSVDTLDHVALDLERPRIRNLQRAGRMTGMFGLVITAPLAFLFVGLIPAAEANAWAQAPLAGLALQLAGPAWLRIGLFTVAAAAACVFLAATVRSASAGTHGVLARLVDEGVLGGEFRRPHHRFGTPFHLIDATAAAQVAVVVISGGQGQIFWLAHVYAAGAIGSAILKTTALLKFRFLRPGKRPYRVPLNFSLGKREWPVGLLVLGALLAVPAAGLAIVLDPPSVAGALLIVVLTGLFASSERALAAGSGAVSAALDEFQLLPSGDADLRQVEARPGNFLVPVRKPHAMTHLEAALRAAGDRDVVAMTVRLVGQDVPDDPAVDQAATDEERKLLSAVVALAERERRAVRLLIVPGVNVFDSVIETAVRLESAEIHVGESETLSADDQARRLGEAWERASKPKSSGGLRLVVHHPSGGVAAYPIGAHAPTLQPEDFADIHRLWLDVANAVGPHVHHRDVVRAALKLMENELSGPDREAALQLVREMARPADELAAMLKARDFARLRDMLRNRDASDLASVFTDLPIEDQVLVFRILPRKEAASTFEYLSAEAQHALLKAMASEDVAALLNEMAPDDRTMFLEELPAEVTRQLLSLLTPEERAVAVKLLGYPEGSIGRLMTPHYVAVREEWTVAQVLDYIRAHGEDSETLNVIYVVDGNGQLIDDIRIREFLLTSPATFVRDLMDRRFVALKATDAQETAVQVFRAEDRTALPVTDSAGILIGIVTVDDMLDVAEAEATEDIQRFGGSEALDEPYMEIGFADMIKKRAGWLTALFLGEMLTATAMGVYEHQIARAVVLALFVPLIISSGGNSGSQASTLVIRALALGEVHIRDWWRVMRREFAAGLVLGGILGSVGFLRITLWSTFSNMYGEHWLLVALTVGIALVGVVLWGSLIGSLLPFVLRRLGFDPAASSAPFVATIVDVTGLVIYFSVAVVLLRGTLL
jgi:magnesium transporter